jgi:hypothetical protein
MENELLKYGLSGICIAGLAWYILHSEESHRKERKEWRDQQKLETEQNLKVQKEQFDRINEISDTSNQLTRENTNILTGLKTLLENPRR